MIQHVIYKNSSKVLIISESQHLAAYASNRGFEVDTLSYNSGDILNARIFLNTFIVENVRKGVVDVNGKHPCVFLKTQFHKIITANYTHSITAQKFFPKDNSLLNRKDLCENYSINKENAILLDIVNMLRFSLNDESVKNGISMKKFLQSQDPAIVEKIFNSALIRANISKEEFLDFKAKLLLNSHPFTNQTLTDSLITAPFYIPNSYNILYSNNSKNVNNMEACYFILNAVNSQPLEYENINNRIRYVNKSTDDSDFFSNNYPNKNIVEKSSVINISKNVRQQLLEVKDSSLIQEKINNIDLLCQLSMIRNNPNISTIVKFTNSQDKPNLFLTDNQRFLTNVLNNVRDDEVKTIIDIMFNFSVL